MPPSQCYKVKWLHINSPSNPISKHICYFFVSLHLHGTPLIHTLPRIRFVTDNKSLPPPVQQRSTAKPTALAHLKKRNQQNLLNNATTRSMPTSPALGAVRSPLPGATVPTSAPVVHNARTQKLQALRTPLIHLLAVRPVSEKFLAQKIACSQEECREVLEKVGKPARLDTSKWDLSDRSFKELDVWKFNYPCQEDRQEAIDKAVSAFDRLRLSREDWLWQMLYPKEERGQGKCLSNLNLHQGPIQRSTTPRISVQATDDAGNGGHTTGNDSDGKRDRLAPSDAEPMARSKSQDQVKKKKISEKELQAKRLLSKNPKKPAPTPASKPKPKSKEAKEVTPGSRKTGKKVAAATSSTFKSTEFVHDSDEDEVMEDASTLQAKSEPKVNEKPLKPSPKPISSRKPDFLKDIKIQKKTTAPPAKDPENRPPTSSSSGSGSKHRFSDSSQSSAPMTKSLSRQRTTSSPHKPSPLGSSPPTNASDLDNGGGSMHASSTSSTPLISQVHNRNVTPSSAAAPARPCPGTPRNTSEHSLKRKHDDVDSEIHSHNVPPSNGLTNGLTNGYAHHPKRPKTSPISPPTSESSNSSNSPPEHDEILTKAQRFKTLYAHYEKLYREVSNWPNAPKEKVESVMKMHERLVSLKGEFAK